MKDTSRVLLFASLILVLPTPVDAALWSYHPGGALPGEANWSNKCELADLNADGYLDILFANGRGYASPGGGERNQALLNPGDKDQPWADVSNIIFGKQLDQTRAIKVRDFNQDGLPDIFVANSFQTQSRLYQGVAPGLFLDKTLETLPQANFSFGDAETGDVDGDGDLDIVLADWGPGNALSNEGGLTRLWLNDGNGVFTDVTVEQMPTVLVRFSWEMELADVDNDFDLDVLVSCKSCGGSTVPAG